MALPNLPENRTPAPYARSSRDAAIEPGAAFAVPYPFVRGTFRDIDMDTDGYPEVERPTWQPGTRLDAGAEDVDYVADGIGTMVLTVVSVHKPGRFPTRVFFTRQWINPDGKAFGKGGCRMVTLEKFERLSFRYQHDFEMASLPRQLAEGDR